MLPNARKSRQNAQNSNRMGVFARFLCVFNFYFAHVWSETSFSFFFTHGDPVRSALLRAALRCARTGIIRVSSLGSFCPHAHTQIVRPRARVLSIQHSPNALTPAAASLFCVCVSRQKLKPRSSMRAAIWSKASPSSSSWTPILLPPSHPVHVYQWSRRSWRMAPGVRGENKRIRGEKTVRNILLLVSFTHVGLFWGGIWRRAGGGVPGQTSLFLNVLFLFYRRLFSSFLCRKSSESCSSKFTVEDE